MSKPSSSIPPDSPFFWNTGAPSVMRPVDSMAAARAAQARKLQAAPAAPKPPNTLITLPGSSKRKTPQVMRSRSEQPGQIWVPESC